jgi:hypothetical protein
MQSTKSLHTEHHSRSTIGSEMPCSRPSACGSPRVLTFATVQLAGHTHACAPSGGQARTCQRVAPRFKEHPHVQLHADRQVSAHKHERARMGTSTCARAGPSAALAEARTETHFYLHTYKHTYISMYTYIRKCLGISAVTSIGSQQ